MKVPTTSRTDVSSGELQLRKLDNRDRMMRAFEALFLFIVVVFNVLTLLNLQSIIRQNQQDAIEARRANAQRQVQIQGYIKCILLIRYDNPNLSATSPRGEVETALDKCAKGVN